MANNPYVNKVVYGNDTVMDISDTTATEGDVVNGKTFYKASGARSVGSAVIPDISNCYETTDTAETALADEDYFPFYDTSATAKRKTLWSNIKSKLKTYFDSLYILSSKMIPVTNDIATMQALTDGDDDYVINAYTAKRWSNVDAITLYTTLQAGTDTIGEWDDDWEQTTSRQGWMFHELLQGILTNDNVHYEITFDPLNKEVVVLNSWRVDDTYYAEVTSPSGNPSEQGFYELVGSTYVLTSDTTVQGGKTYYKLGGAVAIKFCYAPSVDVRVGIKLQILRTQVIPVEILP